MSFVDVFAASKSEAEPVQRMVHAAASATSSGKALLRLGWNEFLVIVGGMGPKAARAKAMDALGSSPTLDGSNLPADQKPDAVLVIGLCGSPSSSLPETRIVAYTDCLSADPNKPALRCSPFAISGSLDLLSSQGITCDPVTPHPEIRTANHGPPRIPNPACREGAGQRQEIPEYVAVRMKYEGLVIPFVYSG